MQQNISWRTMSNKRRIETLYETIKYKIVLSEEATDIRIDVDINGVKLVIPVGKEKEISNPDELILDNSQWILKKKGKYEQYLEQAPQRIFKSGEKFPYLDDLYELTIKEVYKSEIVDNKIVLSQQKVEKTSIKEELEKLYRAEARSYFKERVDYYSEKMKVNYKKIMIWNQRTRWASCSSKGNISFNWRLTMAPSDIIDYIVVHELAHLQERNHTNTFWRIVANYIDNYKEKANWLNENSVKLIFTEKDL